eukprot:4498235-Pyramimonas_sp.AAC.1
MRQLRKEGTIRKTESAPRGALERELGRLINGQLHRRETHLRAQFTVRRPRQFAAVSMRPAATRKQSSSVQLRGPMQPVRSRRPSEL